MPNRSFALCSHVTLGSAVFNTTVTIGPASLPGALGSLQFKPCSCAGGGHIHTRTDTQGHCAKDPTHLPLLRVDGGPRARVGLRSACLGFQTNESNFGQRG